MAIVSALATRASNPALMSWSFDLPFQWRVKQRLGLGFQEVSSNDLNHGAYLGLASKALRLPHRIDLFCGGR